MKKRIILILILAVFASSLWASEEILIKKWKVIGPFMTGPRELNLDFLTAYGGEDKIVPSEDQIFYSLQPNGGVLKWFEVESDSSNVRVNYPNVNWEALEWFYGSSRRSEGFMNNGYAYGEIECQKKIRALIFVRSVVTLWVNGVQKEGEFYTFGYNGIPVVLDKGKNTILLKFRSSADGSFGCRIQPVNEKIHMLDDFTTPDIIREQKLDSYIGVPLVNTTDEWQKDLTIVAEADDFFQKSEARIPPLAPLSVMKVPLSLIQKNGFPKTAEQHELKIKVFDGPHKITSKPVTLRIQKLFQPHKVTFLSRIDNSVQYFGLRYPIHYSPSKSYGILLSLHGSGDEGLIMAGGHENKDWAFVVAPTDRRPWGFGYHAWGRIDLHEVLDLMIERFNIDEDRICITGASMGGYGSIYHGLMFPSKFAAIAPEASSSSRLVSSPSHLQRSNIFALPGINYILERIYLDQHLIHFTENALHLPITVIHGGADRVVCPINPRLFQSRMKDLEYDLKYREVPGKPHFWFEKRLEEGNGRLWAVCIDHPEVIDFFEKQRRKLFPKKIIFRLVDLSCNDTFYWIKVKEQKKAFHLTEVRAEIKENTLLLQSKNVTQMEIHLPSELVKANKIHVNWNEKERDLVIPKDRKIILGESSSSSLKKTPSLYGPLRNVFFKPFVLVYGTQGSDQETALLLNNARIFARRFWRWANGFTRIIPDEKVDEDIIANYNLILFGSPSRNAISAKVSSDLPIRIESKKLVFGGRTFKDEELGMALVYPNPLNQDRLMALYAGTTPKMERTIIKVQPIDRRVGAPDFVVAGRKFDSYGWANVKALGYFSPRWDLENKDYYLDLK